MEKQVHEDVTDRSLDVLQGVPLERRPKHIAIVMDGNGRWAQQRGLPRSEGHWHGSRSVQRVVEESVRLGISWLTLYCFSSENWKRPEAEVQFLMELFRQFLREKRVELMDQRVRLSWIGRRTGVPEATLAELDTAVAVTAESCERKGGAKLNLCLAFNYGARQEIADATRQIANLTKRGEINPETIDEQMVTDYLYTKGRPDPDLLIRTAGEMRLSNFLLWQCSYAELWVTPVLWPDFDESLLRQAVRDYAVRDRRFGGVKNGEV
ncbi:MAG: polyprenyl diphosphate synthase [Thermoguttaceae bacterium]|nr:polyprenyl diphosphate synthase [Thermoguttaceae bacterium]